MYSLYIMYTMYMKQYNVVEFRKNLREVLNYAESGEKIYIERHGVQFVLLATHNTPLMAEFSELYPKEVSSNIRPHIENIKENPDGTLSPIDPTKKSRLATPTTVEDKLAAMSENERKEAERKKAEQDEVDSRLSKFAKEKGMKFCANGHAIPAGRSKCMGKGCKYA